MRWRDKTNCAGAGVFRLFQRPMGESSVANCFAHARAGGSFGRILAWLAGSMREPVGDSSPAAGEGTPMVTYSVYPRDGAHDHDDNRAAQ